MFTALAEHLADRYTVVTYDPRGHSRSVLDGAPEDVSVELHADDAARLIDAVGGAPAYVLGSSGGGTIGLALITRHADKVKKLVVHEPPVMELLPDRARWRGTFSDIYDTYRAEGAFPAMGKFGQAVEEGAPEGAPKYSEQQQQGEPSPEQAAMMQRMMGNFDFFLAHEIRAIGGYVPDIAALKAARDRIVIAGGKASGEQGAYRAARTLADAIGIELTYFEGGHGGFGASDDAFAQRVRESLSVQRPGSPE
jgi:pimeloyl-ACP methyl ester carboxylesterase